MQEQHDRSLLVCLTPLQMLIASKIVEQNPGSYDLLCLSYNENEKYDYYFGKLEEKCNLCWRFFVRSESKIYRIFDFLYFIFFLRNNFDNDYSCIYVASVDNPFVHVLLSKVKKNKIITFDDGSANINRASIYHKPIKKSGFQVAVLNFLGNTYDTSKVIAESQLHYTIYENIENILKNTTFISLFSELNINGTIKEMKIFLGQPLNEIRGIDLDKIFNFLIKEGVKYYFPHPRERNLYEEFSYINSSLIFEDYILGLLRDGYCVDVYTILSTAAINVAALKHVNIHVLHQEEVGFYYPEVFDLFVNIKNCNMCEL